MSKTDYSKALQSARTEFKKLLRERAQIDNRIIRLKQTITGLMGLCDANQNNILRSLNNNTPLPPRFMRLTSAIRQVLAESISPMRPPELRDALRNRGLNLAQYANKLAVIHNTLTRLERQGEVAEMSGGWILTEKGTLACKMDSLDFPSPVDTPAEDAPNVDDETGYSKSR
jgi:hypothetical protein